MNKEYFNGKFNLILCSDYEPKDIPKNVIVRKGKLEDVAFTIRQEELDNDEVFSGNVIINDTFENAYLQIHNFIEHNKPFNLSQKDGLKHCERLLEQLDQHNLVI